MCIGNVGWLGADIEGWDLGMKTMRKGERARFTIPPELAYGEEGSLPDIPPNTTLMLDVELLDVFTASQRRAIQKELDKFGGDGISVVLCSSRVLYLLILDILSLILQIPAGSCGSLKKIQRKTVYEHLVKFIPWMSTSILMMMIWIQFQLVSKVSWHI